MEENTKRSVFGLHGIFGIMISIVGLLVILASLMLLSIISQRTAATNAYDPAPIRDVKNLKMISTDNKNFAFQKKDQ